MLRPSDPRGAWKVHSAKRAGSEEEERIGSTTIIQRTTIAQVAALGKPIKVAIVAKD